MVSASGERSRSTTAMTAAQAGTAARPRHHLFTWRGVTPASRAKAAWEKPARARSAVNVGPVSLCKSPL